MVGKNILPTAFILVGNLTLFEDYVEPWREAGNKASKGFLGSWDG